MNLDEWVDLVKHTIGVADFRMLGVEFLRETFDCTVQYTDGPGDGGVDAWVVLQSEPLLRVAAQFHAGRSVSWESKLANDLQTFCAYRDLLPADDSRKNDFTRLLFVCAQTPAATSAEIEIQALLKRHGVAVQIFDARAIVSLALGNRGVLLDLLARRVPGGDSAPRGIPSARDEVVAAFSFFHESASKYRWAVAKSGVATILHRAAGAVPRDALLADAAQLLRVTTPSRLLERTLRNLEREDNVLVEEGDVVRASPAFADRTRTALAIARADEEVLRARCAAALEPLLPKKTHYREERARRAVDAVLGDLGLLVQSSVVERAARAMEGGSRSRQDEENRNRWRALENRLAHELVLDRSGIAAALDVLIRVAADSAFAKSLAAAELFLRITEHDATEFAQALETNSKRVIIDASIAMPMLCALYDRPATTWMTSVAAHALYESLRARGASCVVPAVYVEEMAAHLLKARAFATIVETESDLERSGNYFVAHFCSTRGGAAPEARSSKGFRDLLGAFGALPGMRGDIRDERERVEEKLATILGRYGFEVVEIACRTDDPVLADEPKRADILLQHDRAVVRSLRSPSASGGPRSLVCTADLWLQGILNELGVTALDAVGLADLMELVRPTLSSRSLLAPVALASAVTEEAQVLAAEVWDEIVTLEGDRLADWKLVERARTFRASWLAGQADRSKLRHEWPLFRDEGPDGG